MNFLAKTTCPLSNWIMQEDQALIRGLFTLPEKPVWASFQLRHSANLS